MTMAAPSESKKMITLITSDNESFKVEEDVILQSQTIKNMIEDGCADNIPLPNLTATTMAKVIEYLNKHAASAAAKTTTAPPPPEDQAGSNSSGSGSGTSNIDSILGGGDGNGDDEELKKWDEEFATGANMKTRIELILAAHYLDIGTMIHLFAQAIADEIKGWSVEKIRDVFHIENDFTPEEEAKNRKENAWAFEE